MEIKYFIWTKCALIVHKVFKWLKKKFKMVNYMNKNFLYVILLISISSLLIGCSNSEPINLGQGQGLYQNSNLTDEERQELKDSRQQQGIVECETKNIGDSCETINQMGVTNVGTCQENQDLILACTIEK